MAPGQRALGLFFEVDVQEVPRLPDLLIGLRVRRVRDVAQMAGSDRHVVHFMREARWAWSPHVIVDLSLDAARGCVRCWLAGTPSPPAST